MNYLISFPFISCADSDHDDEEEKGDINSFNFYFLKALLLLLLQ